MRIAVIGAGISGLGAAYRLAPYHTVELFERDLRPGGHTQTVVVDGAHGALPIDVGFIVHNEPNYPNLVRMFEELGVLTQPSEMSFSVSCRSCGLEYSGRRPFAQPGNLVRPRHYLLLREIVRFLRTAGGALRRGELEELTLAGYVAAERFSLDFQNHFLVPLTAALWSAPPALVADFPIAHAVRFFDHHGMLGFRRFSWRTVSGGAMTYVDRILERLGDAVRLGLPVRAVERGADGAIVVSDDGVEHAFDKVVMATHADTALAMLADPSPLEARLLGAFPYIRNHAVLHTDESLLPRRRAARASWNYQLSDCASATSAPTMTYYLNRLQQLSEPEHYCVTLNQAAAIADSRVLQRIEYAHPLFTRAGVAAQRELGEIQGDRHTYYCGAWQGFGFHEDGLTSGLRVAAALGAAW